MILLCLIRRNSIPHPAQCDSLAPARSALWVFGLAKFLSQFPKLLKSSGEEERENYFVRREPRVARSSQPWAVFFAPVGASQSAAFATIRGIDRFVETAPLDEDDRALRIPGAFGLLVQE